MIRRAVLGLTPLILVTLLALGLAAHAEENNSDANQAKMDIVTQNALIEKLEQIMPQLTGDASKIVVVKTRLADLYSERARLKDMTAGEKNCNECKDAEQDRIKAIDFYESVYSKTSSDDLKRITLQLAHLYKMTNRTVQAEKTYKNILANKKMAAIHSKAHLGLADIEFEKGNYEKAKKEYNVSSPTDVNDKIYVSFRLAWTELNLGRTQAALIKMQTAVFMAQNSGNAALLKDLMRDYATILARNPFTAQDVNKYISFSTAADRAENLKFLGEESERLGNKRGSLLIWTQYNTQEGGKTKETAEIQLKMAQNYYDLNDYAQTLSQLDKVVNSIEDGRCTDCKKVISEFRGLLIVWNKREKTEPSKNLTQAYAKYLKVAGDDFEVMVWAGQVAREQKDLRAAYNFYEQAAKLASKQGKAKETDMTSTTAIEIAEELNDAKVRITALNRYLELNPKGERRNLVIYQLADMSYQAKDWSRAASDFQKIALDDSWNDKNVRVQAADLSLDALKNLGKDGDIRSLSLQYSRKFADKQQHFAEIARKVTVNRVVGLSQNEKGSKSDLKSELENLKAYSLAGLSSKDRIAQLKTQILAAEKIGDVGGVENGSRLLLQQEGLSNSDLDFAQKSLLWVYELRLDFKNAFAIAREMTMPSLSKDQRALRIGLLAELAGQNPEGYFKQYVATTLNTRNANEVRLKLIRRSHNGWAEFDRNFNKLRSTPDLLARIALELHLAKPNLKKIKHIVAVRGVFNTAEGQYMNNLLKRLEFAAFAKSVSKAKLNAKSDRTLKHSIKERITLLGRLNQRYTAALRGGDLSLQIITLNSIAFENHRFYSQLNNLPVPKGLRKQERAMYKKLLLNQSAPYAFAAKQAEDRRVDFFSTNDKAVGQLLKLTQSEDKGLRAMAMSEYAFLKGYMSKSLRGEFESNIRELKITPSKVVEARRDVGNNPLDASTLAELRELESKRANGPMLAYLDERIAQLKTGTRR